MRIAEKQHGFFWHWQNLKKEDSTKQWLYGRAWLHHRPQGVFGVEWNIPTRSFHIDLTVGGCEDQLRISVACRLFGLYLSFERWPWLQKWKAARDSHGKETSLAIHHWALWWRVWHDEHVWKSTTPKWRHGTFHIDDFFLGKQKYTCEYGEVQQATLTMPEASYPVEIKPMVQTWKRPRWPWPLVRKGFDIDIPGGVPIPGKGENSWDCDDDAIMATGSSAPTIQEALDGLVKQVNKRRERYGGKNWLPGKA